MQLRLFVGKRSALFIGSLFAALIFLVPSPASAITATPAGDDVSYIDDLDSTEPSIMQPTIVTVPFLLNGVQSIPKSSTTPREITAEAIELSTPNAQVTLGYGSLTPNISAKNFAGMITFDEQLEPGTYRLSIKVPKYATQELATSLIIAPDGSATMTNINQPIRLFAGDIDYDGMFSILDYNLLAGCMRTINKDKTREFCSTELEELTDLNEDDLTDQIDYNLFLRSLRELATSANAF